jgi:hypothetical protein
MTFSCPRPTAQAQARLAAEGRRLGYGVHAAGRNDWDGTHDAFSQFADAADMQLQDLGLVEAPGLAPCPPDVPPESSAESGSVRPWLMRHPAFAHRIGPALTFAGALAPLRLAPRAATGWLSGAVRRLRAAGRAGAA